MNERREQTMTTEMDDRDGARGTETRPEMTDTGRSAGNLSTADMAAAMNRQSDGDGTATATTARDGQMTETGDARSTPLFSGDETESFRSRWTDVQTGFVDEPRRAVEQADGLVAEVIQRLAQVFAEERTTLEQQWGRGDDVSTEDLRVALQRYRSFFERLLSA